MFGGEYRIQFDETRVAHQSRREFAAHGRKVVGGGKHSSLVCRFVICGRRSYGRSAVQEVDHGGDMKNVLIESCEHEEPVLRERASKGASELMLAIGWFEIQHAIVCIYLAVAQVVESAAMPIIRT